MIFKDDVRKEYSLTNFFDCNNLGEDRLDGVYFGIFYYGHLIAVTASEWRAKGIASKLEGGVGYKVQKLYHVA